jgi:hypothetical protein
VAVCRPQSLRNCCSRSLGVSKRSAGAVITSTGRDKIDTGCCADPQPRKR